ncbi:MAG: alcohol dehydrogenase catalytic domain-containing protein [Deltaproteobacteria bacterium]|nr:alcohol dehydrogenase catalytic domain-containing protein [Deltaproteobacteria bacterium]
MRVATYYNNNTVKLEERPVPQIGPHEILVKTIASGICGSDVMEWYRIKKAPIVLGHEITGVIEKTGSAVTTFKQGDRVSVSHHVPCNTCYHCLRGNHTVCHTLHTTNFDPGGFSEFIRVPQINVDRGTFILPDTVSFEDGVYIEPLGCVIRGLRSSGFRAGDSVLILGSGISGLLFLLLAQALGAGKVFTTDISGYRLKMAQRLGATAVLSAGENIPEKIKNQNNGRLADIVIVCAGALAAYDQALKSVECGGTILCFAPTDPNTKLVIPANDFWRNAITILPSYASSPLDTKLAIELIDSKRVPVSRLTTHRFGLQDTDKGFKLVAEANESMKVIIEPQR